MASSNIPIRCVLETLEESWIGVVLGVLDDESSGMEVYQSFPKASTTVTRSGTTLLVALDGWRNLFNSPPF